MDIHSLGPIDPGESFASGDDQMERVKLILSLGYGSITTQALTYEFFLRGGHGDRVSPNVGHGIRKGKMRMIQGHSQTISENQRFPWHSTAPNVIE
nr:hypothetical protein [Pseudomonas umsongensis]